jgi:hypothetical protein
MDVHFFVFSTKKHENNIDILWTNGYNPYSTPAGPLLESMLTSAGFPF